VGEETNRAVARGARPARLSPVPGRVEPGLKDAVRVRAGVAAAAERKR
jgi:hypothetical protein